MAHLRDARHFAHFSSAMVAIAIADFACASNFGLSVHGSNVYLRAVARLLWLVRYDKLQFVGHFSEEYGF